MPVDEVVVVRLPAGRRALWSGLAAAARDLTGAVRVVVLRGEGSDFFHETDDDPDDPVERSGVGGDIDWIRRPDLVAVAVVTGRATGAGLLLAMACDLRLATVDAELAISADQLQFAVRSGRPKRLPIAGVDQLAGALGSAQLLELTLTGRRLSGLQAAALGIVNHAVPAADLDGALTDMVGAVLATPHIAATLTKALLSASGEDRLRGMAEIAAGLRLSEGEQ